MVIAKMKPLKEILVYDNITDIRGIQVEESYRLTYGNCKDKIGIKTRRFTTLKFTYLLIFMNAV